MCDHDSEPRAALNFLRDSFLNCMTTWRLWPPTCTARVATSLVQATRGRAPGQHSLAAGPGPLSSVPASPGTGTGERRTARGGLDPLPQPHKANQGRPRLTSVAGRNHNGAPGHYGPSTPGLEPGEGPDPALPGSAELRSPNPGSGRTRTAASLGGGARAPPASALPQAPAGEGRVARCLPRSGAAASGALERPLSPRASAQPIAGRGGLSAFPPLIAPPRQSERSAAPGLARLASVRPIRRKLGSYVFRSRPFAAGSVMWLAAGRYGECGGGAGGGGRRSRTLV